MNTSVQTAGDTVLCDAHSVGGSNAHTRRNTQPATRLPSISPWLLRIFSGYSRWYVARHFHSVRLSRSGTLPQAEGLPLVIYLNHASWWDPLICLSLRNELFASHRSYAPIDAAALQQYRFFARLGFFGVEQNNARGAVQFLRAATNILSDPGSILWLTPQGRFTDVRERPVQFKPGLSHLAARIGRAAFVPLALEYSHWQERKPEVLCRFGPMEIVGHKAGLRSLETIDWHSHFEAQLASTQDALAAEVQRRTPTDFSPVLQGGSGVGFMYDTWRAIRARLTGRQFQREHGKP